MGLAGPKNRTKLSKDPNNTNWSNDNDRFGHKILSGLGWTPGSTLGAKGAKHSTHYTDASASHIRVLLKDDNLGLGAKRGKADDQFGLAIFQNLLGRLNGKSDEERQKDDDKRRDVELRQYQTQRFGAMHFVSGGFLVGDKIEQLRLLTGLKEEEEDVKLKVEVKREENGDDSTIKIDIKREEEKPKKRKRSMLAEEDFVVKIEDNAQDTAPAKKKSKKTKDTVIKIESDDERATLKAAAKAQAKLEKEQRKQANLEKRARKEARRLKKEEKQKRKEAKKAARSSSSDSSSSEDEAESTPASGSVTPATMGNGRNILRQRYIQQKRAAWASDQALKEIFMIKTPG